MMIEKLQWDSDFFGLRIGRAEISSEEDGKILASQMAATKKDYDLVYILFVDRCDTIKALPRCSTLG